jgi:heme/copper-type cytochrome/quinol oxidase subunit 2
VNLVDLVVGIVVVTILVTVVVGVGTYVAYKFRLARRPGPGWDEEQSRYFVRYRPDEVMEERGAGAGGGAA